MVLFSQRTHVNIVDIVKSFPTSIYYLLANFGFDTTIGELFVSRTHLGFLSFRKPNDF